MFLKQFVGERFWQGIGLAAAFFIAAIFARGTMAALPILLIVLIGTTYLTWRKTTDGLLLAFLEIIVGGHGHLLEASVGPIPLSLRTAIFGGVMLGWGIQFLQRRAKISFVWMRDVPWMVFGAAIMIGAIVGFTKHPFGDAFDDMNGYLSVLYLLPIISVAWTQEAKREILQILAAGTMWIVFLTLLLSFAFNHLPGSLLKPVYAFVRDSRVAEVTIQVPSETRAGWMASLDPFMSGDAGYWYRIFLPDQFFVFVFLLICLAAMFLQWREQRLPGEVGIVIALCTAAGLLSMSRSFFLGFGIAAILLWLRSFFVGKHAWKNVLRRSALAVFFALIGVGLAWGVGVFPYPSRPDLSSASFYKTSKDVGREAGVSSRWNLLGPLHETIVVSPILGSGFGTSVTYQSDDPRIKAETGTGEYTTYRFEWGYQDLWIKMGFLSLIFIVVYLTLTGKALKTTLHFHEQDWIVSGLAVGAVLLFVSHAFSPYLNHPIGISYLLFCIPFLTFPGGFSTVLLPLTLPSRFPSVAPMNPMVSPRQKG